MRTTGTAILAAALLLPLAAGAIAANRGILHTVGDKDTTSITPSGDMDTFVFDLPAGSALSVVVKAGKKIPLQPAIALFRTDGSSVAAGELTAAQYAPGKTSAKLSKFPIDETGRWAIAISAHNAPQVGAFTLQTKAKYPKGAKVKGEVLPQGGFLDIPVPLAGGTSLSLALKRKSGGTGLTAPTLRQPSGAAVPLASSTWTVSDKGISAKSIGVATGAVGDYVLRVPGPTSGGDAVVDYVVKVKWPKHKGVARTISSDEPAINSVSPDSGNFGTQISVAGTRFAEGALLEVGGFPATNVTRNLGGTQMGGIVPTGTGVRNVTVVNPDGQENTRIGGFTYIDPPTVASITPNRGPASGGTPVTIKGTNFRFGTKVVFGGLQVLGTLNIVDAQTITLVTEATPSGLYTVEARDISGQSGNLPGAFTFDRMLTVEKTALPSLVEQGRFALGTLIDLDRDLLGKDDLVISSPNLTSDGAGGFLPATRLLRGNNNRTFADLTGTSFPSPFFPSWASYPAPLNPSRTDYGAAQASAVGDLDGDGDEDLVLSVNGYFAPNNFLRFNNPKYPATSTYPFIPSPNLSSQYYTVQYPGTRVFLNGGSGSFASHVLTWDGNLRMAMPALTQGIAWGEFFQARAVALGDLDGDGDLDLLLAAADRIDAKQIVFGTGTYTVNNVIAPALRMLANDGAGRFSFAPGLLINTWTAPPSGGENFQATSLAVADFDKDGKNDIVLTTNIAPDDGNSGKLFATRLLVNGGGTGFSQPNFAFPAASALDDGRGTTVVAADIDADGRMDVIVATTANLETVDGGTGAVTRKSSTRVFRNGGNAVFSDVTSTSMPAATADERWKAAGITAADLDKDGDVDLVLTLDSVNSDTSNPYLPSIRVLLNNGAGVFTPVGTGFIPAVDLDAPGNATPRFHQGIWVRAADLDGDGDRDLVLGTELPVTGNPTGGSRAPAVEVLQNR